MADQSALHSLLTKIRDLGSLLVSVHRIELDMEVILSQITDLDR